MPIRTKNGGPETVLREEFVGSSSARICYPGVDTCITITGVLPGGLVGTHITVATEIGLVDDLLQAMRIGGGGNCQNFYVIGRFTVFKPHATQVINTRKKISKKIKSIINKNATVRFYDSSAHGSVHVFVEKNAHYPNFFLINSHGNYVAGYTYPTFEGRTQIDVNQFVLR